MYGFSEEEVLNRLDVTSLDVLESISLEVEVEVVVVVVVVV